jgi:hypothetical protein
MDMSDKSRKLWAMSYALSHVAAHCGRLGDCACSKGEYLRPLELRFISDSKPIGSSAAEAFARFRREQDDIASGVNHGPIRRKPAVRSQHQHGSWPALDANAAQVKPGLSELYRLVIVVDSWDFSSEYVRPKGRDNDEQLGHFFQNGCR